MTKTRLATPISLALLPLWLVIFTLFTNTVAAQKADDFLDVSIAVFTRLDSNTNHANGTPILDPAVKAAVAVKESETRLLPMYLRYRLEQANKFGAVRVVPTVDNGAELRIAGVILHSDGSTLELVIRVTDSTGQTWLNNTYKGGAVHSTSLSGDTVAEDAFAALFNNVVRDLTQQLTQHAAQLNTIKTAALLRYGYGLAPAAFASYVTEDSNGILTLQRQPASNDPILQRILAIREREYLFIDVVDESYQRFYRDVKPVYDLWRQAQEEQIESSSARTARELKTPNSFARGSYRALQDSYNNYRWAKVQELYVDELGEGFVNEVEPTQLSLKDSVYKLSGTIDQQYREWRGILAEMFALETTTPQ